MRSAIVGGREMSADVYRLLSNEQRGRLGAPVCPECRIAVHAYAVTALNSMPRFDHPDAPAGLNPLDDCSLACRGGRLRWFGKDALDRVRGERIRAEFFESDDVVRGFNFCVDCTGRGNLRSPDFGRVVERADRIDIWSYAGIETWCVPHVLLLLSDFRTETGVGFNFALQRAATLSSIWTNGAPVMLTKLFSDSGRPFSTIGRRPNPRPILQSDLLEVNVGWMSDRLVRGLRSFGRRPREI